MRAATTPYERLRRKARPERLDFDELARLLTYSVGDYVWARFGGTRGIQLARIVNATPIAFYGVAEWWWVSVFWPSRGWRQTHRRVLGALNPFELHGLREAGVVEVAA